ncbi:septum site-determining protein MinC [Candidatus Poribacteria bacterium]|nr:septum site-determining protein MinC [Candidatus Poribacteria bacterium]
MKDREPIAVRGYRNGLYITIDDSIPESELAERIMARLEVLGSFIKGAGVMLEVGTRTLDDDALRTLQKLFQRQYGMTISQLIAGSDTTRHAAEILRIRAVPTLVRRGGEEDEPPSRNANTVTVRSTLRSGALERYLEGNILVIGDVNPGAEVIASGDIIVLGTLRGVVHAGAMGDENAVVIALNLLATQLRIAHCIARSPEGTRRTAGFHPEMALVEQGQIVVRPFTGASGLSES